ncbi:hypothetical protein OAM92_01340 [Acidimicrobiales bacterium]|jgi:hypothetical protein|nr:hypothetical protein [Acidimicrobiales bacterium]
MTASTDITALRALWTEAERKMYPLATVSPEKYQALVRIARRVADELSTVSSEDEMVARWRSAAEIVDAASLATGAPLGDLPAQGVAGVGFALRDAELRTHAHAEHLVAAIRTATRDGQIWALLHERGNLSHGLLDPYSAIELHLASGVAIVSSVEPNPADGRANHVLTVILMDPASGDVVDIDPNIAITEEHESAEPFLAGRVLLRQHIESMVTSG